LLSLLHNENPRVAKYGKRAVGWGLSIGERHNYSKKLVSIDVVELKNSLRGFINSELKRIETTKDKKVWIEVGIKIKRPYKELKQEFKDLEKL
jgi:hypothetical protein